MKKKNIEARERKFEDVKLLNPPKETDWSSVYKMHLNAKSSFENCMNIIDSKLNTIIPVRKVKNDYKRTPRLHRITKSIIRSINRQN